MEKGGLTDAVRALKVSAQAVIIFADELRVGCMGDRPARLGSARGEGTATDVDGADVALLGAGDR